MFAPHTSAPHEALDRPSGDAPGDRKGSFAFDGHEVFYRREGAGPPMVFLHNGGTSHRIWEPLLERYRSDHDVIAMDMLGFGLSDRPRIEYTLDLYVAQLGALLDELGLGAVTLVGNCMGSATALRFAAQDPERVDAVVAFNVLTEQTIAGGSFRPMLWLANRHRRAGRLIAALSARLPKSKLLTAAATRSMLLREPDRVSRDLLDHLRDANREPDQMRVLLSIFENIGSFTGLEAVSRQVPVCVIWGGENRVLPAAEGAQFCADLQPDREVVLPNCAHLPMLERPQEVAAVLDAFLAEAQHGAAP